MEGSVTGYTFQDDTLQRQNKKLRSLDPAILERLASTSTLLAACREKSILSDLMNSPKSPQQEKEAVVTISSKASSSSTAVKISTLTEKGLQAEMIAQSDPPPVLIGIPQIPYLEKTWPMGILFDEDTHKYRLVGLTFRGSATSIIHGPFAHFDEQAVSKSLTMRARPGSRYFGKTQAEILEDWEAARNKGTLLHLFCETYLNGVKSTEKEMRELPKEYHYFLDFLKREFPRRGWRIDATELILSDLESETVGMIDAVASYLDKDGKRRWVILDWKRTRTLTFKAYQGKKGKWPCHEIEDCNGGHYSLQLNLYPELLQMKRGIYVEEMFIGRFYPECDGYELHRIPLRRKVVRTLIASRRRNLCRLDHAEWLWALHQVQKQAVKVLDPSVTMSKEPVTKRRKVDKEETNPLLRLCTLWIRLAYRSCSSFWLKQAQEPLLKDTHSLLLRLLTSNLDENTQKGLLVKIGKDWKRMLDRHISNGETAKDALLWPLVEKTTQKVGQELGKVPLSTYFRSRQAHQPFSSATGAIRDGSLLDSCGEKTGTDEDELYTQLLEIKKATPYLDQVGLCETHEKDRFEDLHFGTTAFGMSKEEIAWHFYNVIVEKKKGHIE